MSSTQKHLAEGSWGGEHASLTITAEGGAVEFDCAHGTLNTLKVEYVGVVKNGKLRLSIRRVGNKRAFAVFNLVHGQEAMLFKCR